MHAKMMFSCEVFPEVWIFGNTRKALKNSHFGSRYESLSPARIQRASLDEARRYPLAVTPAGFKPLEEQEKQGIDDFAEQSWTRAARSRSIARNQRLSSTANNGDPRASSRF